MSRLPGDPRRVDVPRAAALASAAVAVLFALYTEHAWEDYYISYRAARNLALGEGLVFQPGQRVQSFTSPLNVLLLALLRFATGSDGVTLWLYRLASVACLAAGVYLALDGLRRLGVRAPALAVAGALLALDLKLVDYSINGQEAAFVALALGLSGRALATGQTVFLGLSWAAVQWSRPDGFVPAGGLLLAFLLFDPAGGGRLALVRRVVPALAVAFAAYGPWLLWTTWYYGSPVPHTVVAKGGVPLVRVVDRLLDLPVGFLAGRTAIAGVFQPIYAREFGGWPEVVAVAAGALALGCGSYWLLPFASRAGRAFSLAFLVVGVYLAAVAPFPYPWYYPPATLLGALVVGAGVEDARRLARLAEGAGASAAARHVRVLAAAFALGGVLLQGGVLLASARQLQVQQALIEDGHRTLIGRWLRASARTPQDTVFLEPLGYIGFHSGLHMFSWPGLSSPEVVAAMRRYGTEMHLVVRHLRPDWLVLRPAEAHLIEAKDPTLLQHEYRLVRVFDVRRRIASVRGLPGRAYLEHDAVFEVFRRAEPAP